MVTTCFKWWSEGEVRQLWHLSVAASRLTSFSMIWRSFCLLLSVCLHRDQRMVWSTFKAQHRSPNALNVVVAAANLNCFDWIQREIMERGNERTAIDYSDHRQKCRICFESFLDGRRIRITKVVEKRFSEVTQTDVSSILMVIEHIDDLFLRF